MHYLAGSERQVATWLEGFGVGHLDLPSPDIAHEMLHALDQVLPAARNSLVDHLRVGERHIGGADGIQELAQVEGELALLLFIEFLYF